MDLQLINEKFSICKVKDFSEVNLNKPFVFTSKTDKECSVICPTAHAPKDCIEITHNWNCFRIAEDASFGKYGMIAFLSDVVAKQETGILVVATYDTDYILIKEEKWNQVKASLEQNNCCFI